LKSLLKLDVMKTSIRVSKFNLPTWAIMTSVLLFMATFSVTAQNRLSFELRGNASIPTKDLGTTKLQTGFGFEGTLGYRFMPHLGAYGGWSWNKFTAKETKMDYEETGYNFGLQFIHPIGESNISYMLKGGATYNHIETENTAGEIINDTKHGWGCEFGLGLPIQFGGNWRLTPEVRYRSLTRDMVNGTTTTSVDLNYISAGLGLSVSF
jgi:Outer membrane protein beta-barrel domain